MGTSWLSADPFVAGSVACSVPGSTKCTRCLRLQYRSPLHPLQQHLSEVQRLLAPLWARVEIHIY